MARRVPILEFKNISFSVKSKEILHGVDGSLEKGTLMAILGPSGSGKTTLLDSLSGRKSCEGDILLNGSRILDPTTIAFRRKISYVSQISTLKATETVKETLQFAARMKRSDCSKNDKKLNDIVEKYLDLLDLSDCQDVIIGSKMLKGCSGGQIKRCAIGVEILNHPKLLFLDEPTSGLDSFSAVQIIKTLRKMCDEKGCSVIMTLHCPSSEMFDMLDKIALLNKGSIVFCDETSKLAPYMESLAGKKIPKHYNPCDFALSVVQNSDDETSLAWAKQWKAARISENSSPIIRGNSNQETQRDQSNSSSDAPASGIAASWFTQFKSLSARNFRAEYRNYPALIARFGMLITINIIVGIVFQNVSKLPPTPGIGATPSERQTYSARLRGEFGALILILISTMFGTATPVTLQFPLDRLTFEREYSGGFYSASAYFLSKFPMDFLLAFICANLTFVIIYPLYGLSQNFEFYALTVMALGLAAAASARVLGSIASDATVAIQLVPLIFVPQMLFAGVFVPPSEIPQWLNWAQYLCTLKYASGILMVINWPDPRDSYQEDFLTSFEIYPDDWYIYLIVLLGIWFVLDFTSAALLTFYGRRSKKKSKGSFFGCTIHTMKDGGEEKKEETSSTVDNDDVV
eukprot:g164.t1